MKAIIHDLGDAYDAALARQADFTVSANGRYAPCMGCFRCWTQHPAACAMTDTLHTLCRRIGLCDELSIITANSFGSYSPNVKNILDRTIGVMTPLFTFRGHQMHHIMRYGHHTALHVYVHGQADEADMALWQTLVERNRLNLGFAQASVQRLQPDNLLANKEAVL